MSAPPSGAGTPITDRRQLVEYMEAGNKPRAQWRAGTEHEKFGFLQATLQPIPYEGAAGVRAILEGLAARFGWQEVRENGKPIALTREGASITLEPGGQFELSGAPLATVHESAVETDQHLSEVKAIADPLGIGFLGMGHTPTWRREDFDWMPKGRYAIMRSYMPKKGTMGLDMMLRTCTVQTNVDFADEADMVKKFRVSLALQPVATALYANSPFVEGVDTGFVSRRSHIWTDTDPDRCGMLPFVFEDGFGFERYVDWLLDVPMYFAYRNGKYIDLSGKSFRDFMAGRLHNDVGDVARLTDWSDHITTAFPEVRLKRFLEMRGSDCGPRDLIVALPALWMGVLYDQTALDAAWDLVKDWSIAEHDALRAAVPRLGLRTQFRKTTVQALAQQMIGIADAGLRARRQLDGQGRDETMYLDPLRRIADSGVTLADEKRERVAAAFNGKADALYKAYAF
ncbi:glutamate--cysteine ligase [Reyranella sp. CPCC 100927]|uniref:glutamate--cysteine ligase n=1 Tax=Reyranella sp. CPCC 100927 TaxID=2599616 RepID=UPI0011B5DB3E|nr:glutamate--cysteine ligase [Reyranella sp. CPCC 100927]TWT02101.1 glutamate--cysteine ligase [Reyranella sp. CPCC 100927]